MSLKVTCDGKHQVFLLVDSDIEPCAVAGGNQRLHYGEHIDHFIVSLSRLSSKNERDKTTPS